MGLGWLLGWGVMTGLTVGHIVSVASTMVLSRLLTDRGELQSQYRKVMIGITLAEDLSVVVLTILMPVLVSLSPSHLLRVGKAIELAALILVPIELLATHLVPLCWQASRWPTTRLMVSASPFAHRALDQMWPLRDAFVAIVLIDPRNILAYPHVLLTILLLVIVGKFIVWTGIVKLFRYPLTTAILVGVGLTQIGEFSFILVQVARERAGWRVILFTNPGCLAAFDSGQRGPGRCGPKGLASCLQLVYHLNNPQFFGLECRDFGSYTFPSSCGSSPQAAPTRPPEWSCVVPKKPVLDWV
jgi:Kef-type K+ transport system membrane component KefB